MSAFSLFKSSAELLVSAGAGAVVGNAIKASIPVKSNTLNKVTIAIGGFAISSMLADFTSKHTSNQIDELAEHVRRARGVVDSLKADVSDDLEDVKTEVKKTKNKIVDDVKEAKDHLSDEA